MKTILTLLIFLIFNIIYSQNPNKVNDDDYSKYFYKSLKKNTLKNYNLESIEDSDSDVTRIWHNNEVYILGEKPYYIKLFKNAQTSETFIYKQGLNTNITLAISEVKNLKPFRPIDCIPTSIEVLENKQYFIKEVGCNQKIQQLMYNIYSEQISQNNIDTFISELPSGGYAINLMRSFIINQPIKDEKQKSEFYKKIEKELLTKNISITNARTQPLIKINSEILFFEDLNKLDEKKIESYKILNKKECLLYGENGKNGVLIIKTLE